MLSGFKIFGLVSRRSLHLKFFWYDRVVSPCCFFKHIVHLLRHVTHTAHVMRWQREQDTYLPNEARSDALTLIHDTTIVTICSRRSALNGFKEFPNFSLSFLDPPFLRPRSIRVTPHVKFPQQLYSHFRFNVSLNLRNLLPVHL